MSSEAIRGATLYDAQRMLRPWRRAWEVASVGAAAAGPDPEDWIGTVAVEAARNLDTDSRQIIKKEVEVAHPNMTRSRLQPLIERATAWRIADICVPLLLNGQQKLWARHGSGEPLDYLTGATIPLPSERIACIETVTWAEMRVARWSLEVQGSPLLDSHGTLAAATWWVTISRLYLDPTHPEKAIPDDELRDELIRLDALADSEQITMKGQMHLPGMEDDGTT